MSTIPPGLSTEIEWEFIEPPAFDIFDESLFLELRMMLIQEMAIPASVWNGSLPAVDSEDTNV